MTLEYGIPCDRGTLAASVLDELAEAVLVINRYDGRITAVNKRASVLYGYSEQELCSLVVGQLESQMTVARVAWIFEECAKSGRRLPRKTQHRRNDGIMLLVAVRETALSLDAGSFLVLSVGELSYKHIEYRLSPERDKLSIIGRMAAGMAHEIRNPLTSIKGFAQLLARHMDHDPALGGYVEIILQEIDRANSVLSDFLALAKPRPPKLLHQSMRRLIEETVLLIGPSATLKGVKIQTALSALDLFCHMDRQQMKQVLLNLCQNAIDAIDARAGTGEVTLELLYDHEHKEVCIEVVDNGCGIPANGLANLGVPFYTTKDNGTGLGLSVSFAIVRAHGGRIDVDSIEGHGSRFRVCLPCRSSEAFAGSEQIWGDVRRESPHMDGAL